MKDHLINCAVNFLEEHWDELDLDRLGISESKEEFIERVKEDEDYPEWVLLEAANWGVKDRAISYTDTWLAEHAHKDDFDVWNIGNRYFTYKGEYPNIKLVEVFPKEVTIKVFE